MGVDAEELILNPFHDVVDRGKEAVNNAESAADEDAELSRVLARAGVAVVKEGDRALKRLQPLWDGQVEKYGDAFKESLSQNAAIEEKRRRLEDLLYDFEDYAEPDTFEPERFTELQAATKSLAMDVIDVIKKMKLDTPITPPYSPPSPSKFPPLPPLPPLPLKSPSRIGNGARSPRPPTPPGRKGSRTATPLLAPLPPSATTSPDRTEQSTPVPPPDPSEAAFPASRVRLPPGRRDLARLNTGSQRSLRSNGTAHSRASSAFSVGSLPPPAYTADGEAPPVPQITHHGTIDRPESRASSSLGIHVPQAPQNSTHHTRQPSLPTTDTSSIPEIPDFPVPQPQPQPQTGTTRTTAWVSDQAGASNPRYYGHRPASRFEPHSLQAIQNLQQTTIPEDQAVTASMHPSRRAGHSFINFDTPLTPIISELGRFGVDSPPGGDSSPSAGPNSPETTRSATLSHATSMSSIQTGSAYTRALNAGGRTPITPGDNFQPKPSFSPITLPPAALEGPEAHSRLPDAAVAPPQAPGPASEDWATRTVLSVSDRASTANLSSGGPQQPREADTAIGPRSSLYLLHGFCSGAQQFRSSGHADGVRRVAGHVAGQSTAAARCESCSYGHAWTELDMDVRDRLPRATFPRAGGLLFRIRLLYKSHLGAPRPSEAFYGCLFCARLGRVVREGDATVFSGSDDLLRHLASHPQPLPEVPGITVLYGKEVLATDPRVNDFDLWLTEPPQAGGVPPGSEAEVARLPVATAVRGHVQRYGEKKLPRPEGKASDSLLQFFEGSRVIGVEYPGKNAGKWCTGWHDGVWGYFPAKSVELEKPKPGRLDAPPLLHGIGGSVVVAAKWKWDPGAAAKEGWLAFDKGEKLTNVGWPADAGREAWCWSGSTSKGRFGVFPRSHIDESSLRDDASSQGPGGGGCKSKRKEGGGRSAGKLFGVRRHSTTSSMSGGSGVIEII